MWTLGKGTGEYALNVVIKEYDGQVLTHFHHYFKAAGENRRYLAKKGVAMNLSEWGTFLESLIDIDAKRRQLRCKNMQVEPIPPTGIERNLQSAFGREDEWMWEMFVLWVYAQEG